MSTPATICFREGSSFYVYLPDHGSPKEVAEALVKTLLNPSKGNNATQFIRANPNTELTEAFDWNSNSYQYTLTEWDHDNKHLTVYKVKTDSTFHNTKGIFSGDPIDFIQEQLDPDGSNKMFRVVRYTYSTKVMNQEMALRHINNHLNILRKALKPFPSWSQESSRVQCVTALVSAFPELMTTELEELGVVVPQPLKEEA